MKEMKANGVHFGWALPSPTDMLSPPPPPTSQKGNADAKRVKVFSNEMHLRKSGRQEQIDAFCREGQTSKALTIDN